MWIFQPLSHVEKKTLKRSYNTTYMRAHVRRKRRIQKKAALTEIALANIALERANRKMTRNRR
mgnify:CR=1 FL=1